MKGKGTRGRPRAYEPEAALAAALGEFRRRGYTATSLDHLSEATGMARPSLYAAFGNKLEIYRQAVRRYAELSAARRRQALFDDPSPVEVLADDFIDKCHAMGFSSQEILELVQKKLGDAR